MKKVIFFSLLFLVLSGVAICSRIPPYFRVPLVTSEGDVVVLDKGEEIDALYHLLPEYVENMHVLKFKSNGEYIKIDSRNRVYIGWHTRHMLGQDYGGVYIYDSEGTLLHHVHKDIECLLGFSVSTEGFLYVNDWHREIKKYSFAGELVLSWNALAPQEGETWQVKQEREKLAKKMTKKYT